ncbi:amidohydrolase [Bordetella genomosp. 8]|uniref:Amidohydrolase n=1 Tax=Bordetella genomosp. 8 TaxID=1416806 RepID=A0A1W6YRW4_9BORD|nr:amidohydrolase family protein [Bordetella genomosp. 8]ARP83659.1 amidohydrolase [Bordetella genomosp. 8]
MNMPTYLHGLRLPAWMEAPRDAAGLTDISIAGGCIAALLPSAPHAPHGAWQAGGALALPALVDAHTHLDKTFTRARLGDVQPGLLNAIQAMMHDQAVWTEADVRERAGQGLQWAWEAGVGRLRTHCDWREPPGRVPMAWPVLLELAEQWRGRMDIDCVNLAPLPYYASRDEAMSLARRIARDAKHACLGAFVHTSNWQADALGNLVRAAADTGLRLDLHVDEELAPEAVGLSTVARLASVTGMRGRIVCGHACALAAMPRDQALRILDDVADAGIRLVCLPATNLLLQDARTGHTPRMRGLTLVQEARERGIPVLLASDNVQDPFCASGSYDPLDALGLGALAAQLGDVYDDWSQAVCRRDWLDAGAGAPLRAGDAADLIVLPASNRAGFPSRAWPRLVLRRGVFVSSVSADMPREAPHPRTPADHIH